MNRFIIPLAASAFIALGLAPAAVSAAPANPAGFSVPDSNVSDVRITRRQMRRHRVMRHRVTGARRYAPSQAGNARDAQRPPSQQNQGMTTGGPRY